MTLPIQSLESVAGAAVVAGSALLLLALVSFGAFAYKSLTGGVEWPNDENDENDGDEGESVHAGDDADEWEYY